MTRNILLFFVSILLSSCVISAQDNQQGKWQKMNWEKWGLHFTLPPGWKQISETANKNEKASDGYYEEIRTFSKPNQPDPKFPTSDFSVIVTSWPGETVKIQGPTRVLTLTPEQLMDAEQGTPSSWEKEKRKELENLQYLQIGGLRGVLMQLNFDMSKSRTGPNASLSLSWHMYRVYNGNVQRLSLRIEGKRRELDTMKRIISSFEFS